MMKERTLHVEKGTAGGMMVVAQGVAITTNKRVG